MFWFLKAKREQNMFYIITAINYCPKPKIWLAYFNSMNFFFISKINISNNISSQIIANKNELYIFFITIKKRKRNKSTRLN